MLWSHYLKKTGNLKNFEEEILECLEMLFTKIN